MIAVCQLQESLVTLDFGLSERLADAVPGGLAEFLDEIE